MLMHQLMLVLHYTSAVLQPKSIVYHPLEVLKVMSQSIIQTIQETFLLLLISVYLIGSIARQLGEHGDVVIH
jgi:hypothetical protein